jgi:hypothetical protein
VQRIQKKKNNPLSGSLLVVLTTKKNLPNRNTKEKKQLPSWCVEGWGVDHHPHSSDYPPISDFDETRKNVIRGTKSFFGKKLVVSRVVNFHVGGNSKPVGEPTSGQKLAIR